MQPSKGFEEGQEGYVPSLIEESEGEENGGGGGGDLVGGLPGREGDEDQQQQGHHDREQEGDDDQGQEGDDEDEHDRQEGDDEDDQDQDEDDDGDGRRAGGAETGAGGEEPARSGRATVRHFYVDVQNPGESNYSIEEQHIAIDPKFLAQVQTSNDNNINQFLSLPELIPAKKRKRQQPLLDFTQSIILTSADYSKRLEEILAKKKTTATAVKKKKRRRKPQRSRGSCRGSCCKSRRR